MLASVTKYLTYLCLMTELSYNILELLKRSVDTFRMVTVMPFVSRYKCPRNADFIHGCAGLPCKRVPQLQEDIQMQFPHCHSLSDRSAFFLPKLLAF